MERETYLSVCRENLPKPKEETPTLGGDAVQGI